MSAMIINFNLEVNMKKLLVVIGVLLLSTSSIAETLRLDIGEWLPYTSEKESRTHLAEVIVIEAFKTTGIEVEFRYYPWKRSYENVKKGKSAGTFPWYPNEERQNDFYIHKEPLLVANEVFFHLKSTDFSWENYEDLKPYKLGGTIGYAEVEIYKKHGLNGDIVPKEELNFRKLLGKRIDATPSNIFVGYNTIHRLFPPEKAALFTNHPKPFKTGNLYMLFSKKIPNMEKVVDQFDKGLKQLKVSGQYDTLIGRFLNR